jgi:uncharacterized protein (DUF58 family)
VSEPPAGSALKPHQASRPFALVPRRRFLGVQFGRRRSSRRGLGDEVAGTRPYRPGDLIAHIHWAASARLSEARGTDEFVVREFFAEQAPRVALVHDRRPGMAIHSPPSPWLDKRAAAEAAGRLIEVSAAAEQGELISVDGSLRRPVQRRIGSARKAQADGAYDAPAMSLSVALEALVQESSVLPTGSFVFVVSDFLVPVSARLWLRLRALRWDVVPVIVQDPVWEQTFPPVGGVVLPVADPVSGDVEDVWVSAREARERGRANEQRLDELLGRFRRLGFDPVLVDTSDPREIGDRFRAWADRRRRLWTVQA